MLHVPANINILILKMKDPFISTSLADRWAYAGRIPSKVGRIFVLVLLLLLPCQASIVIVWLSSDAIYIGADGRLTVTDDSGKERFECTCKVKVMGLIVVAATGTFTDSATNFDLWKTVDAVKASSVEELANRLKDVLPSQYQRAIEERTRRNKSAIQPFIPGDLEIASFKNGHPASIRLIFISDKNGIRPVIKNDGSEFVKNIKTGITSLFPVGNFGVIPIDQQFDSTCDIDEDPVGTINCNIERYIAADPAHINKPIAIVKITPNHVAWERHGACGNQPKENQDK